MSSLKSPSHSSCGQNLPILKYNSARAYGSRLQHSASSSRRDSASPEKFHQVKLEKKNVRNLELPNFRRNKDLFNGRSKSAKTKEERVAAEAKWTVCHEANRYLKLFTKPAEENPLALLEGKKREAFKARVLAEDKRTTEVASSCSKRAGSTMSAARQTFHDVKNTVGGLGRAEKEYYQKLESIEKETDDFGVPKAYFTGKPKLNYGLGDRAAASVGRKRHYKNPRNVDLYAVPRKVGFGKHMVMENIDHEDANKHLEQQIEWNHEIVAQYMTAE